MTPITPKEISSKSRHDNSCDDDDTAEEAPFRNNVNVSVVKQNNHI